MPDTELFQLAPPPAHPVGGPGVRSVVEAELGTALPSDFWALVEAYGEGQFQDFLALLVPFSDHGPIWALKAQRDIRIELDEDDAAWVRTHEGPAEAGDRWPPLFPEPRGLLPWAFTDNGDLICWRTGPDPETWTCVIWNPRGCFPDSLGTPEEHPVPAAELLTRWLDGTLNSPRLGVVAEPGTHGTWFEPSRHLHHVEAVLLKSAFNADECLRRIQARLTPLVKRYEDADPSESSWYFLGGPDRWTFSYSWYQFVEAGVPDVGHRLTIGFPPGDDDAVRCFLLDTTTELDCDVRSVWRENADATGWLLGK